MEENIKTLLLNTLHSNETVRNNAEAQLKTVEKRPDLLSIVQNVLMKHQDQMVKQISSIYFANTLKRNWKAPELVEFISGVMNNMLLYLMIEDRYPSQAYEDILQAAFENSEMEVIEGLVENSLHFLNSVNPLENRSALRLYQAIFRSETLRFNLEGILSIIFDKSGNIFLKRFSESLIRKDYVNSKMFMKVVARSYTHYSLPDYLLNVNVFENIFNISVEISNLTDGEDESFIKMKKWAVFFLYKAANKGLRKYFKNSEFISFIKAEDTLRILTTIFFKIVNDFASNRILHPRISIITCEFFILIAENKHTKEFIKNNYSFLLTNFILPIHCYKDEIKEAFEFDGENYLRNRYNYVSDDLISESTTLFTNIIQSNKEIQFDVLNKLKSFLDNPASPDYIIYKYAIIGLFAGIQKNLVKTFGEEKFENFIVEHIFTSLSSEYDFIVSQALYFMSLSEDIQFINNSVYIALEKVLELMKSDHEILPVEACLSMTFFLYNENITQQMKAIVPGLLEKVVLFSKQYFLESLSTVLDSIIDCFAEDVAFYAPQFVDSLCANILENIESREGDKVATVSGFITTIEKLIMVTDSQLEIVKKIYSSTSQVIYSIFEKQMEDFYQEAFDIMNSFLFTLRLVDDSMLTIFHTAISIPKDEIMLYPREISDFIDNYLSFAKGAFINTKTLEDICKCIDTYIPSVGAENEDDVYEEDFEAGCRIVNSLMLNAGAVVHSVNNQIIPFIVNRIVENLKRYSDTSYSDMFGIEAIMNCFIIAPESVLATMGVFVPIFFEEIHQKRNKFKRVYDKKVFILFVAQLLKLNVSTVNINYSKLNEAFTDILCSLPEAISKRNKLKEREERDYNEEQFEDEEQEYESDYSVESLEEDIWFETDLDKLNAYDFVRTMLSTPGPKTIGEMAISQMNSSQISRIKAVIDTKQEVEK